MNQIGIITAFVAGLVSFLSPCVLPIVPAFLAFLAGTSVGEAKLHRKEIFLNSVFFVLGFSAVFSIFGVLLNTILERVAYDAQATLSKVGGVIIIFFGIYLTGLIKLPFLERELKFKVIPGTRSRYLSSMLFGAAFAAGWTPCVGAVLGAILGLAASAPGSALALLLAYSLGLGLPFLAVGLFAGEAGAFLTRSARAFKYIKIFFGLILIVLGYLAFSQKLLMVANLDLLQKLFTR